MSIAFPDVAPPWFTWSVIVLFGALIGSFLNVCIYRLPREESIVSPRSRCPKCRHPIAWYDNIPVLSFIALRARCRQCRAPIAWQYPLVELLAIAATVAVVLRFGVTPAALVYAVFLYGLLVASFVDLEFQIIPDEISVGGLAVGFGLSFLIPALHGTENRWVALGWSAVGVLAGGGTLYLTGLLGDFLFKKESMGGGDIKLLAMAGSVLGWKAVLITFFIAPIFALIPGLFVLAFKKSHIIPYGPFLSIALIVSLFAGDAIVRASGMDEAIRLLWEYYGPSG